MFFLEYNFDFILKYRIIQTKLFYPIVRERDTQLVSALMFRHKKLGTGQDTLGKG
jgi:hypothetical protein